MYKNPQNIEIRVPQNYTDTNSIYKNFYQGSSRAYSLYILALHPCLVKMLLTFLEITQH